MSPVQIHATAYGKWLLLIYAELQDQSPFSCELVHVLSPGKLKSHYSQVALQVNGIRVSGGEIRH
jgi:hypothetical protein